MELLVESEAYQVALELARKYPDDSGVQAYLDKALAALEVAWLNYAVACQTSSRKSLQ